MQQWPPESAGSEDIGLNQGLDYIAKNKSTIVNHAYRAFLRLDFIVYISYLNLNSKRGRNKTQNVEASNIKQKKITSVCSLTIYCIMFRKKGRDSLVFCEYFVFLLYPYTVHIWLMCITIKYYCCCVVHVPFCLYKNLNHWMVKNLSFQRRYNMSRFDICHIGKLLADIWYFSKSVGGNNIGQALFLPTIEQRATVCISKLRPFPIVNY